MIVDATTHLLLNQLFSIYQILELGVQQVINIEDFSPPSTSSNRLEAIYLLTPTLNNINLILSDFNPAITATSKTSKKNSILGSGSISKSKSSAGGGAQPKYSAAHLHFIDSTLPPVIDLTHFIVRRCSTSLTARH